MICSKPKLSTFEETLIIIMVMSGVALIGAIASIGGSGEPLQSNIDALEGFVNACEVLEQNGI